MNICSFKHSSTAPVTIMTWKQFESDYLATLDRLLFTSGCSALSALSPSGAQMRFKNIMFPGFTPETTSSEMAILAEPFSMKSWQLL